MQSLAGKLLTTPRRLQTRPDSQFAASTSVSLLLGKTPVVLKGPRHVFFWFAAFSLVYASPSDLMFRRMQESAHTRFIFAVGLGLYGLRKVGTPLDACTLSRTGGVGLPLFRT